MFINKWTVSLHLVTSQSVPAPQAESTAGGGGGGSFKSKEYIESSGISDLSSDSDDEKDESKEEEKKSSPKASDAESAKGSGDEVRSVGFCLDVALKYKIVALQAFSFVSGCILVK